MIFRQVQERYHLFPLFLVTLPREGGKIIEHLKVHPVVKHVRTPFWLFAVGSTPYGTARPLAGYTGHRSRVPTNYRRYPREIHQ
jgi:hypothetical protein